MSFSFSGTGAGSGNKPSSLFGSSNTAAPTSSAGGSGGFSFGSFGANNSGGASGGLFGSGGSAPSSSGNLFGNTSSVYTTTSSSNAPATTAAPSSLFGGGSGATTSGTAFGLSATSGSGTTSSLFGGGGLTSSATPSFGLTTKPAEAKPETSSATATTLGSSIGGGGLFGGTSSSGGNNSGGLFGTTSGTSGGNTSGLFGITSGGNTAGGFGGFNLTSKPTFDLGADKDKDRTPAASVATTSSSLTAPTATMTAKTTTTGPSDSGGGSLFGSSGGGGSLFGNNGGGSSTGSGLFGSASKSEAAPTANTATATPAATSASTGSLFGGSSSNTAAADKPAESQSTTQPTLSLYDGDKGKTSATGASKPVETQPTIRDIPSTAATILESQTLEDILQAWTSELAEQTRVFQDQAKTIGSWDEILLTHGQTLTELYDATVKAEKEQDTLDQSIEHMEAQQRALQNLLDGYETRIRELAEGTSGVGAKFGSGKRHTTNADEERERTYTTVSRLNIQLDDLAERLKSLIKDVNASTYVQSGSGEDKAGPANSLDQIVHILNVHLGALEWIDSQTTQLQNRVSTALEVQKQLQAVQSTMTTLGQYSVGSTGYDQSVFTSGSGTVAGIGGGEPHVSGESLFSTPLTSRIGALSLQSSSNAPPVSSYGTPSLLRTQGITQRSSATAGLSGSMQQHHQPQSQQHQPQIMSPFHPSLAATPRRRW
ncbi:FG-nucleoporin nsp1 [Spiromyces aspiralis]|uniref:FG-nucleoporin nsp1 n=1 Tax=Spiromyces aspiralis TaxID=68401 RepID=A0ACC1I1F3_9FUNG|nr:FG-nucleoporin nsp1 [Spiromyces aspiralis]